MMDTIIAAQRAAARPRAPRRPRARAAAGCSRDQTFWFQQIELT
jgi:hypothetical protein